MALRKEDLTCSLAREKPLEKSEKKDMEQLPHELHGKNLVYQKNFQMWQIHQRRTAMLQTFPPFYPPISPGYANFVTNPLYLIFPGSCLSQVCNSCKKAVKVLEEEKIRLVKVREEDATIALCGLKLLKEKNERLSEENELLSKALEQKKCDLSSLEMENRRLILENERLSKDLLELKSSEPFRSLELENRDSKPNCAEPKKQSRTRVFFRKKTEPEPNQ